MKLSLPAPRVASRVRAGAAGLLLSAWACAAQAITMEVVWTGERCDFIVMRNDAGHGISLRMTEFKLAAGDMLSGSLGDIGYIRKIAKDGTEESGMMQIRKYGIRRKQAFDLIYDWSRYCNPPEE